MASDEAGTGHPPRQKMWLGSGMGRQVQLIACVGSLCLACGILLAAGWAGQPYSISLASHVSAPNQSQSDSLTMMLEHDSPCSISVSAAQAGDEVLSLSGGDILTTAYKLTGPSLQNGDGDWVASSMFLTRSYTVQGNGPFDEITIWVCATSAADRANDAGTYSAEVILTASW